MTWWQITALWLVILAHSLAAIIYIKGWVNDRLRKISHPGPNTDVPDKVVEPITPTVVELMPQRVFSPQSRRKVGYLRGSYKERMPKIEAKDI
jgi:hypothetical protein